MKVLIIGGTGVISRAITAQLLDKGVEVVLFNRGKRQLSPTPGIRQIIGDRADRAAFRSALQNEYFDVVIDMIPYNADDARSDVEAFSGHAEQLIVCSSSAVYRRPYRSMPAREDEELLCEDLVFPYAFYKAEMERHLQSVINTGNELAITIIRPSLTFGRGSAGFGILRQNYGVIERIKQGKPLLMFGDGNNPWSFTFTPDLAQAFVGAVGNPATYGQHYHATSEEKTVWRDLYLEIGKILGKEVKFFNLTSQVLYHAAPKLCAHLYYEKSHAGLFDNSKIKRDIPSFQPRISLNEGLRDLITWFETESRTIDPAKDALEDKLYEVHRGLMTQVENIYPN